MALVISLQVVATEVVPFFLGVMGVHCNTALLLGTWQETWSGRSALTSLLVLQTGEDPQNARAAAQSVKAMLQT